MVRLPPDNVVYVAPFTSEGRYPKKLGMTWLERRFGSVEGFPVLFAAAAKAALLGVKIVMLSEASKEPVRFV